MALRIVEDQAKIEKARDAIIDAFRRHGAEELQTVVGYPGGHEKQTVYWAEESRNLVRLELNRE